MGRRVESEGGVWRLLATSGLGPVREGDTAGQAHFVYSAVSFL